MTDGLTEGLVAFDMFIQDKAYHAKYVTFLFPLNAIYLLRHRVGPKLLELLLGSLSSKHILGLPPHTFKVFKVLP